MHTLFWYTKQVLTDKRESVSKHCHWWPLTAGMLITWKVPHMNVVAGSFGKNKLVPRDSVSGSERQLFSYQLQINEAYKKEQNNQRPSLLYAKAMTDPCLSLKNTTAPHVTFSSFFFCLYKQSITVKDRLDVVQVLFTMEEVAQGCSRILSELSSVVCESIFA